MNCRRHSAIQSSRSPGWNYKSIAKILLLLLFVYVHPSSAQRNALASGRKLDKVRVVDGGAIEGPLHPIEQMYKQVFAIIYRESYWQQKRASRSSFISRVFNSSAWPIHLWVLFCPAWLVSGNYDCNWRTAKRMRVPPKCKYPLDTKSLRNSRHTLMSVHS